MARVVIFALVTAGAVIVARAALMTALALPGIAAQAGSMGAW